VQRLSISLVLLVILTAGCGSEAHPSSEPASGSTSASGSAAIGRDPEKARQVLSDAVAAIAAEDATAFRSVTSLNFRPIIVTEGVARPGAWVATTTFSEPGSDDEVMRALSTDGAVWMQMADWPRDEAKCWRALSGTEVPLAVTALTPSEPAYIGVLGSITATGFGADPKGGALMARISLVDAMRLLPGELLMKLEHDADAVAATDVEIVVGIQNGRLHDLNLRGAVVRKAFQDAGTTLPHAVRSALDLLSVAVTYSTEAEHTAIKRPQESLIVSAGDPHGCAG
jgi:hypothetical protein